jgi:nucleotide-binding universal stress UspA family protein
MTVIVGVDGSVGARAALEFALTEAIRRQSGLRVIGVVQLPAYGITAMAGFVPPPPAVLLEDVRGAVQQHVDEIVTARNGVLDGVPVTVETLAGRPGQVLCDAAGDADLLVVGRHSGHDSVVGGLLGSVALHCVLHARCPVTVVRPGSLPATESDTRQDTQRP